MGGRAETSYKTTHEKVKLFTEFEYAAGTWNYARRVIAKAEFNSLGPNNRFIVTNLDEDGQYMSKFQNRRSNIPKKPISGVLKSIFLKAENFMQHSGSSE